MPTPMTAQSNRNLAGGYIPGLIEEGLTNTQIVNLLRDEGLSYRNQNMFADINRYRLEAFGANEVRGLGNDETIPDRFMRDRNITADYPYSAVVKYSYIDKGTGLEIEAGTTLYFDTAPSQAEVLAAFSDRQESLQNLYSNIEAVSEAEKVYYYKHTGA